MEQGQQQQQRDPQQLHPAVLDGIARLADPRYREDRHKLVVCFDGSNTRSPIVRCSSQHLVDFLDNRDAHEEIIADLYLESIFLVVGTVTRRLGNITYLFGQGRYDSIKSHATAV